jgi:hypothetical protein
MNLYIQIENDLPINHPALEENLIQAFGLVPINWQRFVRVEKPTIGPYDKFVYDLPSYQKIDGVWTDVWTAVQMTEEEKLDKQNHIKSLWANRDQLFNFTAWTFDETVCAFVPPIPRPEVGYRWSGADNNWREAPSYPIDDNLYKFDFLAWQWVVVE